MMPADAEGLAAELVESGFLHDPAWIAAFRQVPRGEFVPAFPDRYGQPVSDRSEIYADQVLPISWAADGTLVSSSSMPSLMAAMLEELELAGTERVLEVGTGTGWNAGLLAHRLGPGRVVSVDIDGELVALAAGRLAALGLDVELVTGDGAAGYPPGAPYDRIMATCSWPRVPAEWIRQTAPGGMIMLNLCRGLYWGGVVRLRVEDGVAEGRFLPWYGGFMPTRTGPPAPRPYPELPDPSGGRRRHSTLGRAALDSGSGFALPAALRVAAQLVRGPRGTFWLLADDGSWARLDRDEVTEGGPGRPWATLERLHDHWQAAGEPGQDHCALRVTATGDHQVRWAGLSWPLP